MTVSALEAIWGHSAPCGMHNLCLQYIVVHSTDCKRVLLCDWNRIQKVLVQQLVQLLRMVGTQSQEAEVGLPDIPGVRQQCLNNSYISWQTYAFFCDESSHSQSLHSPFRFTITNAGIVQWKIHLSTGQHVQHGKSTALTSRRVRAFRCTMTDCLAWRRTSGMVERCKERPWTVVWPRHVTVEGSCGLALVHISSGFDSYCPTGRVDSYNACIYPSIMVQAKR